MCFIYFYWLYVLDKMTSKGFFFFYFYFLQAKGLKADTPKCIDCSASDEPCGFQVTIL